jgi:dephospho-CoA kinase
MYQGKPIIGLAGGIGSGKSYIAGLFAEMGCGVIDSDAQVREVYRDPEVLATIRSWWGDGVVRADGQTDRRAIAGRVFNDPAERQRLESLIHPRVDALRQTRMKDLANDPKIVAFVWDTPLLFEAGLNDRCDAVVFIDTPFEERLRRVAASRGWDVSELQRREKLQWPLDRKRKISDDIVQNTADAGDVRSQVRDVLSRVLARVTQKPSC